MRMFVCVCFLAIGGCATVPHTPTPDEIEAKRQLDLQQAEARRFAVCMDKTVASFGPFHVASQEARLKAAEICGRVSQTPPQE